MGDAGVVDEPSHRFAPELVAESGPVLLGRHVESSIADAGPLEDRWRDVDDIRGDDLCPGLGEEQRFGGSLTGGGPGHHDGAAVESGKVRGTASRGNFRLACSRASTLTRGLLEDATHPGVLRVAIVHRVPPQRIDHRCGIERRREDPDAAHLLRPAARVRPEASPSRFVPLMKCGIARKLSTTASTRGSIPSCCSCRAADVNAVRVWNVNTHGQLSEQLHRELIADRFVRLACDDDPVVAPQIRRRGGR